MQNNKQQYHFWTNDEVQKLMKVINDQKQVTGKSRVNWKDIKERFIIKSCSIEQIKAQYYNVLHDLRHKKQQQQQQQNNTQINNIQQSFSATQQESNASEQQNGSTEQEIALEKLQRALLQLNLDFNSDI